MTDPFFICPATPADCAAVSELFQQSYPQVLPGHYPPGVLQAALPFITTAQRPLLDCGTYFLARNRRGELVGAGGWTDMSAARGVAAPGEGHLRHVATHPDYMRRGLARRLVDQALTSAGAFGIARMNCISTRAAKPFYQAMGFTMQGDIELTLAPGVHFPAIQMTRAV